MTTLLQLVVAGLALGSTYALVALGFVVLFKSTDIFNLAQGAMVAFGAFAVWKIGPEGLGVPFYLAVVLAIVALVLLSLLIERFLIRRMFGKPLFTVLVLTLALAGVMQVVFEREVGPINQVLGDPLSGAKFTVVGVVVVWSDLRALLVAVAAMAVFFVFFQRSTTGIAMRATAVDREAAAAVGIDSFRVARLAWAISGTLAVLAGVSEAAQPPYLHGELYLVAFAAIPAAIFGGLDSPGGAVIGGFVIGVVQSLSGYYVAQYAPWLGANFDVLAPYLIMFIVMLLRPQGLFGTAEVRRV